MTYNTTEKKDNVDKFVIYESTPKDESAPKEFIAKTVTLKKDIAERFERLANNNWQYSKKAVINKLLDEALSKYGY